MAAGVQGYILELARIIDARRASILQSADILFGPLHLNDIDHRGARVDCGINLWLIDVQ